MNTTQSTTRWFPIPPFKQLYVSKPCIFVLKYIFHVCMLVHDLTQSNLNRRTTHGFIVSRVRKFHVWDTWLILMQTYVCKLEKKLGWHMIATWPYITSWQGQSTIRSTSGVQQVIFCLFVEGCTSYARTHVTMCQLLTK